MQSIARIAMSMILVSSAFAAYQTSAKLRRDGVLNLYPFPRVGRAHHTWEVPLNDFYLEYKPAEKRQLYAFPRVGRSEVRGNPSLYRLEELFHRQNEKREGENEDSTGMWFGPRLGRAYKSEEDYQANEHSEPEHIDPEVERKKRHTNE
ncbi:CAPA peptides [Cydia pomonella]|uniref:CAPA peptides n=1 Tax=Cydia pomonella TaxID=82600 RepID=UPI002ADE86E7|nr:CAPA peptides [Cydia pomonella]XP_061717303.1 CAPA peptides [Cydia pomonella]